MKGRWRFVALTMKGGKTYTWTQRACGVQEVHKAKEAKKSYHATTSQKGQEEKALTAQYLKGKYRGITERVSTSVCQPSKGTWRRETVRLLWYCSRTGRKTRERGG